MANMATAYLINASVFDKQKRLADQATRTGANYRAARRAKSHADFTSKIATVSEVADELVAGITPLTTLEDLVRAL